MRIVPERNNNRAEDLEVDSALLRDLFAGLVIAAAAGLNRTEGNEEKIAAQAYQMADAMLKARLVNGW